MIKLSIKLKKEKPTYKKKHFFYALKYLRFRLLFIHRIQFYGEINLSIIKAKISLQYKKLFKNYFMYNSSLIYTPKIVERSVIFFSFSKVLSYD